MIKATTPFLILLLLIVRHLFLSFSPYYSVNYKSSLSGLRLLGIGRNEYIELMNQCRSGKKLFRRKSVCKNLLPVKPVKVTIEPWWLIQNGFVTDEDIKVIMHFLWNSIVFTFVTNENSYSSLSRKTKKI